MRLDLVKLKSEPWRFGLYHVDFTTLKRTLRAGSRKYPEIILESRG